MCNALEELRREGVLEGQREGRLEGRLEGIRATIGICKKFSISEEDIIRNIFLITGRSLWLCKKY